jgi:N6-adenosine-specific RNA methylase IME4
MMSPASVALVHLGDIAPLPDRLRALKPELIGELAKSMAVSGLLQPVVVRPRIPSGYWLIAGWHRLEAAKLLKWEVIDAHVIDPDDEDAARLAEIDENLIRGELSPAERAIHTRERKRIYETLHPETKVGSAPGKAGGGKRPKNPNLGSFVDDTVGKTKRSRTDVARDATRAKRISQIADCVGTSLDQGEELDALAKLPETQQSDLIARAANGDKVSAKHEAKRHARAQKEQLLAAATEAASKKIGQKLYGVIYADPPWRFEPYSRDTGMDRAADNHYPTMSFEEIAAMKVPAADDCVLFLWATAPMLPQALNVMGAWGFIYKSHFVWVKPQIGTGYWNRNRHELLLIGTRGNVPAPAHGEQYASVIEADAGRHSEKPFHFREIIEETFPNLPRRELFARGEPVAGWDQWGNEAEEAAQ